ncbi:uncharacterized protein PV09_02600 [Verruconis gallopava]|uniref:Endopolyphosphatase n=1 Tax=Verruconis gallopava TaxID=253628 RepID=A0A0D2B6U1_9PEZI|nr:uncharacterized protein PV09_02600 [Verruconis gallopava]KIW06939.1 hypothetical protein PV09_02600 [Verruconis gallopava]
MRTQRILQYLALLCSLGSSCVAHPSFLASTPRVYAQTSMRDNGAGRLKGKFLHITDIHPDPFYKIYSSTADEDACHRGKGPAGYYGAETSDCDSPVSLLNATFDWIKDNIRDEIDFVIWTGDSARHDNDERIPRSETQVVSQNKLVLQKFWEVFGKPDNVDDPDPYNDFIIPIVPTLGNNDILPHNIFLEGPNKWTKTYLDVWRQFIPEEQRHQFARGGWFFVEVIPNRLAVISLNTLYFFDSNSAVDGCSSKKQPGYEHFEWLRIQLEIMRSRGMKVILMGHVPPARVDSKMSWDETCWQKYALWQKQYRDVIVGSIFGHMNIDHFMLQDFKDIKKTFKKGRAPASLGRAKTKNAAGEEFSIMSAQDYLIDLRDYFSKIPSIGEVLRSGLDKDEEKDSVSWADTVLSVFRGKKGSGKDQNPLSKIGGEFGERYSVSFVGPSVVPNFFSTIRVFEYNITGLEDLNLDALRTDSSSPSKGSVDRAHPKQFSLSYDQSKLSFIEEFAEDIARSHLTSDKDVDEEKKKKTKKYKFKVPKPPSKSSPPGPAYSPQTFTLLGYTQYFANLTHINNDFAQSVESEDVQDIDEQRWKEGKHSGKVKKGKPHPRKFKFEVEYDTFSDKIYGLKDLTVRSFIDLAKVIGSSGHAEDAAYNYETDGVGADSIDDTETNQSNKKPKKRKANKVWHTFVKRAFVGTIDPRDFEALNSELGSEITTSAGEGSGGLEL